MNEPVSESSADITARWVGLDVAVGDARLDVHRAGRPDRPPLVLAHGLGEAADAGGEWRVRWRTTSTW